MGVADKKISPLFGWLNRKDSLASFIDLENRPPNIELGGFLSLDVVIPIHESLNLKAESLENSWKKTHEYIKSSLEIINADEPLWLDSEEVEMIKKNLGDPPPYCYPIYLITVGAGDSEKIVYIGKTSSRNGRFRCGHSAFTKLHNPKYRFLEKRLYLGAVVLLSDESYQPLEWVKPLKKAIELLKSIEAQLIFSFRPELNLHHVKTNNAIWPISLHIQNFSGITSFLNDEFCWPST